MIDHRFQHTASLITAAVIVIVVAVLVGRAQDAQRRIDRLERTVTSLTEQADRG